MAYHGICLDCQDDWYCDTCGRFGDKKGQCRGAGRISPKGMTIRICGLIGFALFFVGRYLFSWH